MMSLVSLSSGRARSHARGAGGTPPVDAGLTLIELLVVILVIGILAAIAIPSYLGVRTSSQDAVLQADLSQAKLATVGYGVSSSGAVLPAINTQLQSLGYTPSAYNPPGVAPSYNSGSTISVFCIVGTSESRQQYSVTTHGSVRKGFCPFSPSEW